jgi:hypothetical protein
MEPRLEFLIKLWSDSLERDIGQQAMAELEAMLEDAELVERFGQWQAERSATDGADPGPTPELDRRVRSAFKSRSWVARHWPQLLAAAAGLAGLGIFINALLPRQPDVMPMGIDERPLTVDEGLPIEDEAPRSARPAATPRPTLGLPPGFGQRPTKLEAKISDRVELRWTMPTQAQAEVRVLDRRGRVVRTVWRGRADPGRYSNHWNGKDDDGRLVEPGAYRMQARSEGQVLAEQKVDLSAAE